PAHRRRPIWDVPLPASQNFSPSDWTVPAHKAVSAASMALNSTGVLPRGSAPYWSRRATNCGSLTARPISVAILSTMSLGVPVGAISPFQVSTSNPGKPDSATVGTSGSCGARSLLETARSRIEPAVACGMASETFENMVGQMPGHHVRERRGIAAVADIGHLQPRALEKQRHSEVRQAAGAALGISELVPLCAHVRDELGDGLGRKALVHHQYECVDGDHADGCEILDRIHLRQ